MQAAYIGTYGDVDAIRVGDMPDPMPGPGEALVEVRAAALNHLDVWVRRGRPGPGLPMPHVLGSDAAGVVLGLGHGVTRPAVGGEVVLSPGLSCRACAACRRGQHSECADFGIVGFHRSGTYAERVAVPAYCLFPKPAHLSWEEAAALPLAHVTAWRMLVTRARLSPGETVLIHGIGGGVALAALQIACMMGAVTIVTSSSEAKLARARLLGATHCINYAAAQHLAGAVREIVGGGVDVAFDTVGAATWPIDLAAVRVGGRVVLCGVTTGAEAPTNLSTVYWNQLTVLGSKLGSDDDFQSMLKAVAASDMRPVIDSVHPLDEIRTATGRMEQGEQFGKIVVVPG